MARTLLFAVKSEFVTIMSSVPNIGDIQVSYGVPTLDELEQEAIWIGETNGWDQGWVNIGARQIKETFEVAVRFLAGKASQSVEESEQRIGDMFEYAQSAMVDQSNFTDLRQGTNGPQLTSLIMTPAELMPMVSPSGRVAQITSYIKVEGRI